jgi:heme-degrading monooxygenase HmoA
VIPGIEARRIPGFRSIDLVRREREHDVEFMTLMWFDTLDAVKAFMGEDYEAAHVPAQAQRFSQASTGAQLTTRYSTAANSRSNCPPHRPILRCGKDSTLGPPKISARTAGWLALASSRSSHRRRR